MGTPYSEIYKKILNSMKFYSILKFSDDEKNTIMKSMLLSALPQVQRLSGYNLKNRDDLLEFFDNDVPDEVIDIIIAKVLFDWISAKTLDEDAIRNGMSTPEYTFHSPANLLKVLESLRDKLKKEFRDLAIDYSIRNR